MHTMNYWARLLLYAHAKSAVIQQQRARWLRQRREISKILSPLINKIRQSLWISTCLMGGNWYLTVISVCLRSHFRIRRQKRSAGLSPRNILYGNILEAFWEHWLYSSSARLFLFCGVNNKRIWRFRYKRKSNGARKACLARSGWRDVNCISSCRV